MNKNLVFLAIVWICCTSICIHFDNDANMLTALVLTILLGCYRLTKNDY